MKKILEREDCAAEMERIAKRAILTVVFCAVVLFSAAQCPAMANAANAAKMAAMPEGFVRVTDVVADAILDMRYAGRHNFVGEKIDGYDAHTAILATKAALALKKAADGLSAKGYRIKIFDAYRPERAVAHFVRWSGDPADIGMKGEFYPDVDKKDLSRLGYISTKSEHSRGSVVDLTIVHAKTGAEVDMGTAFDFFGEKSHHGSRLVTSGQAENRSILRKAMEEAGFRSISSEWWHYALKDKPRGGGVDFPVDFYELYDLHEPNEVGISAAVADFIAHSGADIPAECGRLVLVVPRNNKSQAFVYALERRGESWVPGIKSEGMVGRNGVAFPRREGSGTTPAGLYSFGRPFGTAGDPGSLKPYTQLAPGDLWIDDPGSKFYNTWARSDMPERDWNSAENLYGEKVAYKYAIAVNYNTDPVVPGAGSAIFLHCSTGRPTAGCISVPEEVMKELLGFIDDYTMILVIGPADVSGAQPLIPLLFFEADKHRVARD